GWNIFKAIMLKEGVSIKNTSITPRTKDSEELLSDSVDAVISYYTSQPPRLRRLGLDPSIMRPIDYGVDFYGDVIFARKEYADEHPDIVEAFNRANRKGWEYALNHKAEMANFLLSQPGVSKRGFNKQGLIEEANELEKLILPKFVEIGHMNTGRWQNMLSIYQELGLADKKLSLKGFIYEPLEAKKSEWYDILVYTLIVGSLVFIIVVFWNRQLRHQVLSKTAALTKEIEEKMMAEDRLGIAMEAAGLELWEWNTKNDEVFFNERWAKLFGYPGITSPQTISSWTELIHPDDKVKYTETVNQLLRGEVSSNKLLYRIKTSTGNWRWLLSAKKITSYNADGKPSKITGMHLDIDSIKRKELELQETTKELLKTNKDLQQFASITSHNLRAPIVNLKSLTEMSAGGDLPIELEEEIKQKIHDVVKQLDITLTDLVEIVSIKSGQKSASETLNFQLELIEVLVILQNQIANSGAKITSDFQSAPIVYFPKRYMESVLINLINNAIAYRDTNQCPEIHIKSYINEGFTILEVRDNGLGINMDRFKNKVFGLYQRFHQQYPSIEGKGLGLFIIKSQIEAMDGKIEVESIVGQGTTFRIYFHSQHFI
ncbi:MAG: ABC transporter substrate-binding protein, partial [Flavobacterium sp.]|nr:ABC transporter substrate-binding protein [Pedobacter sp.]